MFATARLLDRHRLAVLLHGAPSAPVLAALRAYRNPDGGFGHALEPDVRSPDSETTAALHALEVLSEIAALDDPMVADIAALGRGHRRSGRRRAVRAADRRGPPACAMDGALPGGSHLTFAIAGMLWHAGSGEPWLRRATAWCWAKLEGPTSSAPTR